MSALDHVEDHIDEHGMGHTLTAATVVGVYAGTVSALSVHGVLIAVGVLRG
jgi:hypothetical protein